METIINYFLEAFRRWSDFEGRSTRPAFWWFALLSIVFFMFVMLPIVIALPAGTGILFMIVVYLALLVVSFSLAVRRLHDAGMSGWHYLLGFIPGIGFIIMIVLYCQPTEPRANKWGPVPGEDEDDDLVNSLVGDYE